MKASDAIILEDIERAVDGLDISALNGSRILVLGASGLIGTYISYLVYYAVKKLGFRVQADLYTNRPAGPDSRIAPLRDIDGVRIIQQDISRPISYEDTYDFMIHAAGYASPAFFLKDSIRTIDVNYIGMKSVLESALQRSPKAKILYLSSSEIYGSPTAEHFPTPETYPGWSSVTNNRACYIESKRLAEVLCLSYAKIHNLHVRIARPALSYGPGMTIDDGRVISQFISKAHREKAIKMIDDGRDLRCFCYMSDVLKELLYILLFSRDTIYNVGSSKEEISIFALAKMIGKCMSAEVIAGPGKNSDVAGAPTRVKLDMSKLENEAGFAPSVRMEEGLKRTIYWNLELLKEK